MRLRTGKSLKQQPISQFHRYISAIPGRNIILSMIKNLLLISLVLAVLCDPSPHPHPINSHVPRTYKVNIEDSPMVRWAPILKDYQIPFNKFFDQFSLIHFPDSFLKGIEWYARNQFRYQDFVAEVDAISRISGRQFEKLFFLNFYYEYSTFKACTGVVLRNSEGEIIHGRNMDFGFEQLLSNLTVSIEYYKKGKLLFISENIVGGVFSLTVHKPGVFSAEVNTRKEKKFDEDFIEVLIKNAIPNCWLLRKVAEEEETFDSAVSRLSDTRSSAPVYFVVSGTTKNEGIVIEKDPEGVHASYRLNNDTWFLVQTNHDRDIPDPIDDLRRTPAEDRLKARGNTGLTEQELFDVVMSQYPTFVKGTVMTVVMSSGKPYHNTTVWYGSNPYVPTDAEQPNLSMQ